MREPRVLNRVNNHSINRPIQPPRLIQNSIAMECVLRIERKIVIMNIALPVQMIIERHLPAVGRRDPGAVRQEFDIHFPTAHVIPNEKRNDHPSIIRRITHSRDFQPRFVVSIFELVHRLHFGAVQRIGQRPQRHKSTAALAGLRGGHDATRRIKRVAARGNPDAVFAPRSVGRKVARPRIELLLHCWSLSANRSGTGQQNKNAE